jgi:hypothetical protein
MKTPQWAQDLIIDAMIQLESKGYQGDLPDIKWRKATARAYDFINDKDYRKPRNTSSGICHEQHITIVAGHNRTDCKLVILHELAHWVLPYKCGHEGHTPRFWDIAWDLFQWAKLPVRYCLQREQTYRKGAVVAYHNNRKANGV